MLREVALRRAIEDARTRRAGELEEVVDRQGALRRRLRELQDRIFALGAVHGRFAPSGPSEGPELHAVAPDEAEATLTPPASAAIAPMPLEAPVPSAPAEDVRRFLAPPKQDAQTHAALLTALASRHADGFTVAQMREGMDQEDPARAHTYDAAWSLANTLLRSQTIELAGTRPGPAGQPIRVYRVHPKATPTAEVR